MSSIRRRAALRRLSFVLASALALAALAYAYAWATFDREAWLADYAQLRGHVSAVYANLEWALERRGVDAAALHRRTLARLEAARTGWEARAALRDFVGAFHDPHFRIKRVKLSKRLEAWWRGVRAGPVAPARADGEPAPWPRETSAEEACARLGFSEWSDALPFDLAVARGRALPPVGSGAFPAAVLEVGQETVGLVRIGSFGIEPFGGACRAAWRDLQRTLAGPCDGACQRAFRAYEVPNALLAELAARLQQLERAGARRVVVDVTGNGGGTNWVDPAARLFSSRPLACARASVVRHPHHEGWIAEGLAEVEQDLALPAEQLSEGERAVLREARERYAAMLAQVRAPCDRTGVWEGRRPACTNLVTVEAHACGLLATPPAAGPLAHARTRTVLSQALGYRAAPGAWTRGVAVLVDGGTGSAAEGFAAMLADSGGATLLGARTAGAGCGMINGGVPARLAHSGLTVEMPDCVRFRQDGTNELEGLVPDVPVELGGDAAARTRALVAALARR